MFSFVSYESALKCYVCNSAYDEQCGDKIPPSIYLVECTYLTAKPLSLNGISINIKNNDNSSKSNNQQDEPLMMMNNSTFSSCRKYDVTIPEQNNGEG